MALKGHLLLPSLFWGHIRYVPEIHLSRTSCFCAFKLALGTLHTSAVSQSRSSCFHLKPSSGELHRVLGLQQEAEELKTAPFLGKLVHLSTQHRVQMCSSMCSMSRSRWEQRDTSSSLFCLREGIQSVRRETISFTPLQYSGTWIF